MCLDSSEYHGLVNEQDTSDSDSEVDNHFERDLPEFTEVARDVFNSLPDLEIVWVSSLTHDAVNGRGRPYGPYYLTRESANHVETKYKDPIPARMVSEAHARIRLDGDLGLFDHKFQRREYV